MNALKYIALSIAIPSCALAITPTYSLTDLGLLPGCTEAESIHINGRGDAIGVNLNNTGTEGALYHNGKVINVAPTAAQSFASGLNASSQVCGYEFNGSTWVALTYKNGTSSTFSVPGATQTLAESLNNVGQTAGEYTPANTQGLTDHVFIKQPNGTFSDLGQFGTTPSVLSINDQGRALIGTFDNVRSHTFISRPGSTSMEEIPSLIPNGSVSPGQMNNFGVVVGNASRSADGSVFHAYAYYNGRIKDLGVPTGADDSAAWGINNLGQVVGGFTVLTKQIKNTQGQVIKTVLGFQHGFVDLDGTLRDVNGLLNQSGKGWVISECRGINDFDQVLADANFNGGPVHVVKLVPNCVLPNLVP